MSGSETGLIASREAYGGGLQKSPVAPEPSIQNMRLAFSAEGTAVYKPISPSSPSYNHSASAAATAGGTATLQGSGLNMNMSSVEPVKRKRGRPRKYGPDGTMSLPLALPAPPPASTTQSGGGAAAGAHFSPSPPPPHVSAAPSPPTGAASPSSSFKKRGRPPGSTKKQQVEALGSAGLGFTPHVITVKAGEDVSAKVMSFSQHGPRAVCVLSANGAISNVTLRQPATSGGTVTYEGRFEILSLSGSFLLSDNGGHRSRTGGLSVSLAGPDGRVLGGSVAGLLTAAAPIQVVVGSFISDGHKEFKPAHQVEPSSATPNLPPRTAAAGACSPPSRGTLSESSGGGSPPNQSAGAYNFNNNNPEGMSNMPWK